MDLLSRDTTVRRCLKRIPRLWARLFSSLTLHLHHKVFVRPLPDDIIINILSRLPVESVLECRRVCRQWLALSSTPYFVEMHLKRATTLLFLQCLRYGNELRMFTFDEGAKNGKMIKKMQSASVQLRQLKVPTLCGSCNGLLLFKARYPNAFVYLVCNPVTREQISVTPPCNPAFLCGFFFHPLTKEHRLLVVQQTGFSFNYFFMYTLELNSWRKVGAFSFQPKVFEAPAILNGALHWMVTHEYANADDIPPCNNSIVIFDMDSEKFRSRSHPGHVCLSRLHHKKMRLLEMDGKLSFCCVFHKVIAVWILEDYENWLWIKRYKVNLDWDPKLHPFMFSRHLPDYYNNEIKLVNIENGELLLDWLARGLFRYHLGRKTVREIDRRGLKMARHMLNFCYTTAYVKSFVSPSRGFK